MEAFCDAQQVLHTLPCACVAFDDTGRVIYVNAFLCNTLAYDTGELLEQGFERILTVSSRLFYQTHFFPLLRLNGRVSEIFLTLRAKNGKSVPVMVNGTRQELDGRITNLCVAFPVWERQKYENELLQSKKDLQKTLEDNATLRSLRQELEQHQRRLDLQIAVLIQLGQEYVQLNKVLSHDLQEPIRKIALCADILLNDEVVSHAPGPHAQVQKIRDLVERLRSLTGCLQQFINVESIEEELVVLELEPLFKTARKAASEATDFGDFTLTLDRLPQVEARPSQLALLFTEIIRNAIQNRAPSEPLLICVRAVVLEENSYQFSAGKYHYTDHLRLEITDNGQGFDSRYSTYVLGLFNKLDPESEGMGMGLALCRQIVSNHYGSLAIRSGEGSGCTVVVTLPLRQPVHTG